MQFEELNVFYEKYKNEYPTINKGVLVHECPDVTRVIGKMTQEKVRYVFETCLITEINDDGTNLLKLCDGTRTFAEIIEYIAITNKVSVDNIFNGIINFIYVAYQTYKVICFNKNISRKEELKITGSKETYIPLHFVLEITTRCNLHCKHCYRSSCAEIQEDELSYNEIISIVDDMYNAGARFIELTGGEIFSHPEIRRILEYICKRFYFVGLLTNGVLVNTEMIDFLDQFRDKLMWSISLDSNREEFHNEFRESPIAFQRTTQTIKELRKHGHLVRISMSVVQDNVYDIENTLEFAKNELDATWFGYNFILPFGRGQDISWTMDAKTIVDRVREIEINIEKYLKKYPRFLTYIPNEEIEKISKKIGNCGAGWRTVTISPSGNVRPCVLSDEEHLIIGNVKENSIVDIMKNSVVKCLRNLEWPSDKKCKNCNSKNFCKNCYVRGVATNEERLAQGLKLCNWAEKYELEKYIKLQSRSNKEITKNCLLSKCTNEIL